jgi:hypothetical protein
MTADDPEQPLAVFKNTSMTNSSYWQNLWRVELISIISLMAYALLVAFIFVIESRSNGSTGFSVSSTIALSAGYTLLFGLPAVVLYGAPIYCAYLEYQSFRLVWVFVLALIPGAMLILIDQAIGVFALIGGIIVTLATHFIASDRIDTARLSSDDTR